MGKLKLYVRNILVSIDQFFLVLIGGDPDDTWSSCAWKLYIQRGWTVPYKLIDKLLGEGHCKRYCEEDEGKNALWRWMQC